MDQFLLQNPPQLTRKNKLGAPQICTRCATLGQYAIPAITRRAYSSAPATSSAIPTNPTETSPHIMPVTTGVANPPVDPNLEPKASRYPQHEKSLYRIKAGVILSRPPILTREQTDFESAFYLYQKRLNERLSTPFSRQFFFRKGQPAGIDFSIKWSERGHTMAREIGRMTRSGKNAWDDELLMDKGGELADPDAIRERMYIEAESRVSEDGETLNFEDRLQIERPLSRETEADRTGDVKRLDRKLDRTLYLVVKDPNERWVFPQDDVSPGEGLDEVCFTFLPLADSDRCADYMTIDCCTSTDRHRGH